MCKILGSILSTTKKNNCNASSRSMQGYSTSIIYVQTGDEAVSVDTGGQYTRNSFANIPQDRDCEDQQY
jgi:hypothetical protein